MKVPFNEPFFATPLSNKGPDLLRTQGKYYQGCKKIIRKKLGFTNVILTPSCTSALELIALTLNIQAGDEVILPSYTYVSTANAFALRGAKLIFVDTYSNHPSIDISKIEQAITKKTKAIVVVHYGGMAIDYQLLKKLKNKYHIPIVEDAAHCFGAKSIFKTSGTPGAKSIFKTSEAPGAKSGKEFIGSLGDFAAFSFHETKNISCGQGGAAIINNPEYVGRANIIAQCGTNKIDFINKKVSFYSWKSLGSNFLLAEPLCAILLANLKLMEKINKKRVALCKEYYDALFILQKRGLIRLTPFDSNGNGHIFYILTKNLVERNNLIKHLKLKGIEATFHYYPLHLTDYYKKNFITKSLKNTEYISDRIVRLPLFYNLASHQLEHVIKSILNFYKK